MAVYFLYGEEDYNIDLELEKMKAKLNQDFIAMNYKVLDNPDYQTLITVLRTPPMMFGETLIIINANDYLLSNKSFFADNELEDIEDSLKNNPDNLNIVFVVKLPRDENKKPDSRRKLYKILSKFNSKEFPVYKNYQVAEIKNWLKHRAKTKGIVLNENAADLLVEQIGGNLRQLDCEMDKLKLIAHPDNTITPKMVGEITVSNEDLFNITELILKGKKDRALLEFQKLTDKKHPLEILSAIQTILRKWILIKLKSKSHTAMELSRLTGQHEFVVKQTIQKLKNVSASELVKLKQNLFEVEYKIKSADSTDMISEVEIALIR